LRSGSRSGGCSAAHTTWLTRPRSAATSRGVSATRSNSPR